MEENGKKWKTMARDRRPGMPLNTWEMEKMENNGRKWKKWKTMARDRRPGMPLIFVYILGSGSP